MKNILLIVMFICSFSCGISTHFSLGSNEQAIEPDAYYLIEQSLKELKIGTVSVTHKVGEEYDHQVENDIWIRSVKIPINTEKKEVVLYNDGKEIYFYQEIKDHIKSTTAVRVFRDEIAFPHYVDDFSAFNEFILKDVLTYNEETSGHGLVFNQANDRVIETYSRKGTFNLKNLCDGKNEFKATDVKVKIGNELTDLEPYSMDTLRTCEGVMGSEELKKLDLKNITLCEYNDFQCKDNQDMRFLLNN